MPEHLAFFCGRASQRPHYWLGFARGMHGSLEEVEGGDHTRAVLSHGHTPSLLLANIHLVHLITDLSYLLFFTSLALPQNGTRLKNTSDAIEVRHAIFFAVGNSGF